MNYIDKIGETMDIKNWPHTFTKNGNPIQVGEQDHDAIFVVPMICTHCHAEYLNGKESRPPDPCPARNQKREMKRLLS